MISRRSLGMAGLAALIAAPLDAAGGGERFGQINRLTARKGQRGALQREIAAVAGILREATPAVLLYEVLPDPTGETVLWTIELWPDAGAHERAVAAPAVQQSIARCRALTERFENIATFQTSSGVARP